MMKFCRGSLFSTHCEHLQLGKLCISMFMHVMHMTNMSRLVQARFKYIGFSEIYTYAVSV